MTTDGWDYDTHPGDCHPEVRDGLWTVCCRECAGTGVFPVPWIRTVEEGRALIVEGLDTVSCVSCKGTGRAAVALARPSPMGATKGTRGGGESYPHKSIPTRLKPDKPDKGLIGGQTRTNRTNRTREESEEGCKGLNPPTGSHSSSPPNSPPDERVEGPVKRGKKVGMGIDWILSPTRGARPLPRSQGPERGSEKERPLSGKSIPSTARSQLGACGGNPGGSRRRRRPSTKPSTPCAPWAGGLASEVLRLGDSTLSRSQTFSTST